jgi:hypothetical protein
MYYAHVYGLYGYLSRTYQSLPNTLFTFRVIITKTSVNRDVAGLELMAIYGYSDRYLNEGQ